MTDSLLWISSKPILNSQNNVKYTINLNSCTTTQFKKNTYTLYIEANLVPGQRGKNSNGVMKVHGSFSQVYKHTIRLMIMIETFK